MKPDDNELFRTAMGDVTPLKEQASTRWLKSPATRVVRRPDQDEAQENFLTRGALDIVPVLQPLEYRADGLQNGVAERLRRGQYRPDASLNLLRQQVETCRQAVFNFLMQARREGLRNLLIIHGKGRHDEAHANIVRSYLARWLRQFDFVRAFCAAQPQHGGSGALYVGLSKNEEARLDNRERHARRSR